MMRLASLSLLIVLVALVGCEQPRPIFHISGTANYQGSPIPRGTIFFDPAPKQGGNAEQGIAEIREGKFDTRASDYGIQGGDYNIRIVAFDGKVANEAPYGQPLCNEYRTKKTLAAEDQTLNIDIPKR